MYGVAGYTGRSPVEESWANQDLMSILANTWGPMGVDPSVGNYLRPDELQKGQAAAWSNQNQQQQMANELTRAGWNRDTERDRTNAGREAAGMQNQLGYAKLGSGERIANIGAESKIGAAQAKGGFDVSKFLMGEQGKNQRAGQKNIIDTQRADAQDERNRLMEQGLLQRDKPQAEKIPEMILMQMISQEKAAVQKAIGKSISDQEAYQRVMERHRLQAASGQAVARGVMQGNEPAQGQQQQQTTQASTPTNPYAGITKSPQEWAAQGGWPNRANLTSYPSSILDWLTGNPSAR